MTLLDMVHKELGLPAYNNWRYVEIRDLEEITSNNIKANRIVVGSGSAS